MSEVAAYLEEGDRFFGLGHFTQARQAYCTAVWKNTAEADLGIGMYRKLAVCHLKHGDYQRAANAYTEALGREEDPLHHAILLGQRATIYLMAGRVRAALSDIEVATMSLSTLPRREAEPGPLIQPRLGRLGQVVRHFGFGQ